jgi:glycosyltransferase involved in cell wall biosynthesis
MRFVIARRHALDGPDGINAFIYSLSSALMDQGHEVHLVATAATDIALARSRYDRVRFTQLHSLMDGPFPPQREMLKSWMDKGVGLIREINPDFTIINGSLAVRLPGPSCAISHDLERTQQNPLIRRLYKLIAYRKVDKVVTTCSELKPLLAKELFFKEDAIAVIPTCVLLDTYMVRPYEERENAILHMGTAPHKKPVSTIRAFAAMKIRAILHITGGPSPELNAAIAKLPADVRSRINLAGVVKAESLKEMLSRVKAVVVPSFYHAPVASPTVLDGLASGTPVVGSDGISVDLIEDGVSGYRIPADDEMARAAKLDEMMTDEKLWRYLQHGSLQRAAKFDHQQVARRYVELARQVILAKNT